MFVFGMSEAESEREMWEERKEERVSVSACLAGQATSEPGHNNDRGKSPVTEYIAHGHTHTLTDTHTHTASLDFKHAP